MRPTRASLWLAVAIVLVGGACTIRLLSDGGVARAQGIPVRFFDENIGLTHEGFVDPLKFPGQLNSTHLHEFAGAITTDQNSTGSSLLAANANGDSTISQPVGEPTGPPLCGTPGHAACGGGYSCAAFDANGLCPAYRETDGSGWWVPALYDCGTTDPGLTPAYSACTQVLPQGGFGGTQGFHIYWFARQTVGSPTVTMPPTGFAEIQGAVKTDNGAGTCTQNCSSGSGQPCTPDTAGNPTAASTCGHEWRCLTDGTSTTYTSIDNGAEQASQGYNGNVGFLCPPGNNGKSQLQVTIHMAECWNGQPFNVGETHVAYAINKQCPAGFGTLIPQVNIQESFVVTPGNTPHYYRLAATQTLLGSTEASHGDMLVATGTTAHPSQFTTLVNSCLNVSQSGTVPGCNVSP